jgi:hypothetical protein
MNLALRFFRFPASVPLRPLSTSPTRLFRTSFAPHINSTTSAYQTTFGVESNQGATPNKMAQIQNLKLPDGNEIPMVCSAWLSSIRLLPN